jgi:hypothetical protein
MAHLRIACLMANLENEPKYFSKILKGVCPKLRQNCAGEQKYDCPGFFGRILWGMCLSRICSRICPRYDLGFENLIGDEAGMDGRKKKADLPPFKKIRFVRRHYRLGEELSHILQQGEDGLT